MKQKKLEILERNFKLYWQGLEPEISDERFDELVEELKQENPNHPFLKKVGIAVERGTKYVHKKAMLSLDKVYEFEDLKKWIKNVSRTEDEEFDIQYKFDGLAGKYSHGILATRGDGEIGEDISRRKPNIYLVQGIYTTPLLEYPKDKEIIGEIIVSQLKFESYKKSMGKDFANPRNFVAGMINRKEALPFDVKLDFVEYSSSFTKRLKAFEFDTKWQQTVEEFNKKKAYPTDGLVIKLHDTEYADSLGYTEHHPRGSIAFKFYGYFSYAELKDVIWSPGKNSLTPVAIIEPTALSGVTISKVTLHNAKFVMDNDIRIGDKLKIERAGEVIPHVIGNMKGVLRHECVPTRCPFCDEELVYEEPEIRCKNKNCPGTQFQRMKSSLDCFEIDGLGEMIISALWERQLLRTPVDIFRISQNQLLEIPRFGQKSAAKLYQAIQLARHNITPSTVLATLNTKGVGKSMYEKILKKISFKDLITNPDKDILAEMPDIGEIRAIAIVKSIRRNKIYLEDLLSQITLKEQAQTENSRTICFTGTMDHPRSYYHKYAQDRGYKPVDGVFKKLDLLVVPNKNWQSSKTRTAEKFGVKIITLEDWINE